MEWKEYRLSEVIDIIGGGTPKRSNKEYWGGTIPWLSVVDFNNGARFVCDTQEKITENGLNNSSTKLLKEGQLIISARGTVGCLAQLKKPMAFNQSCYGLSGKVGIVENDFLYYLVRYSTANLKQNVHGAVFDTITRETFNHVQVTIPEIPIQKQIAKFLGDLDNKIAINQQINQTLEAMAQATFKSWFVDSEPTRAKMAALDAGGTEEDATLAAMTAISDKSPEELATLKTTNAESYAQLHTTANLFPSRLVESELGEIPEGWELSEIGKEVTVVGGGTPSTKNPDFWEDGDVPWTTPKDLSNLNDKILIDTDRKITKQGLAKISSGLLPVDTVLMSSRAPVGYLALAKVPVAINQGYIAMKCEKALTPEYILQWCATNMDDIKSRASGTTFAEISKSTFRPIPVLVPEYGVLDAYSQKIKSVYSKIENLNRESQTLTQLRDSLLPKLLSGEINMRTGDAA